MNEEIRPNGIHKIVLIGGVVAFIFVILYTCMYLIKKRSLQRSRPMVEFSVPKDKVKKVVLDNGLTLIMFVNNALPKVLMQVAYEVGSSVEQEGEKGLAHLLEHMIFKGTQKLKEGDIDAIARKFGATFNAFTSKETTAYFFESNKNNWKPFIGLLADCMQNARFDSQHLASEMRAVVQELRMRKDNYPSVMMEKATSAIYPANHPYHYPIIGYKEDLGVVNATKLRDFYFKYYQPDKATLFVVGDINPDEVIAEVKQQFSAVSGRKGHTSHEVYPEVKDLTTNNIQFYNDIQREMTGFFWRIPGRLKLQDTLPNAFSHLLTGGEGSRLYKRLVDDEKIASSVYAFAQQYLYDGIYLIIVQPQPGKAAQCRASIEDELKLIAQKGVSETELNKMIVNKQRSFFSTLQDAQSFVYTWMESYFTNRDEFEIFRKVERFQAITNEDIKQFVGTFLDPFLMSQASALPLPENKKELWAKIQKNEELFEQQLLAKNQRTTPLETPEYVHHLSPPAQLQFSFPKADRMFVLENGLKVLLTRKGPWPILSVDFYLKDAEYYSSAKEGITVDLMMDMLMEGSENAKKEDNVNFFEELGVHYHFSQSGAGMSMLNASYTDALKKFLSVLTQPTFPGANLEKLKENHIDKFVRMRDEPYQVAYRTLKNKLFEHHPYEWTFDEALEMLKKMNVTDLTHIHKKVVSPSSMIVSIVGDFDIDTMQAAVKDIFSKWQGTSYQPPTYPQTQYEPTPVDVPLLRDQVVLMLGRPSSLTVHDADLIPVRLLNLMAFYSLGSRLYQLREQSGLFYRAGGAFASDASLEHGFDYIFTIVNPAKVEEAQKGIQKMLRDFGALGVSPQELEAARQLYLKNLIDLVSTNKHTSQVLARLEALSLGEDYYDEVIKRVQTIPLPELNTLCRKYFSDKNMATIRVGRF